jgi:hypothetical protein
MLVLELVARALAPPKPDDPRLGIVVFWLWVFIVGIVTYAVWPLFDVADRLVDRVVFAIWAGGWIAWKFGWGAWQETPREKEEAWATAVGAYAGGFFRELW